MKTILFLLLLASPALHADSPREVFPSDYKPHPCASAELCGGFTRTEIMRYAAQFRGFNLDPRWLRSHWSQLEATFKPLCDKIATCFATPGNSEAFCTDILRPAFEESANRYPRQSYDWDQWIMTAVSYYVIELAHFPAKYREAQACAAELPVAGEPRKLETWIHPRDFGPGYNGLITIHAIDAETRVPVMGKVSFEGQRVFPIESPDGTAMTAFELKWPVVLNRVRNQTTGHEDLIVPPVTIQAVGYEPVTIQLPVEIATLEVSMSPEASQLKPGMNTITVTARDTTTGAPAEMRVMADDVVLGDTHHPLTIEIPASGKRPEIWITSLFDRYSDVVVAPAK
ncbi:MAG TPA: hypothetical protein VF701_05745 [Thermoanaerobaculia bacterium]